MRSTVKEGSSPRRQESLGNLRVSVSPWPVSRLAYRLLYREPDRKFPHPVAKVAGPILSHPTCAPGGGQKPPSCPVRLHLCPTWPVQGAPCTLHFGQRCLTSSIDP